MGDLRNCSEPLGAEEQQEPGKKRRFKDKPERFHGRTDRGSNSSLKSRARRRDDDSSGDDDEEDNPYDRASSSSYSDDEYNAGVESKKSSENTESGGDEAYKGRGDNHYEQTSETSEREPRPPQIDDATHDDLDRDSDEFSDVLEELVQSEPDSDDDGLEDKVVDITSSEYVQELLNRMDMKKHKDNAPYLGECCVSIRKAALQNSEITSVVNHVDGHMPILRSMRAHPHVEYLQTAAVGALWALSEGAEAEQSITRKGGIDCVLGAMRFFSDTVALHHQAAGCLRNLCVTETNKVRLANSGGIDVIIESMGKHMSVAINLVQTVGCIMQLSFNEENKIELDKESTMVCLLSAMQMHPTIWRIQLYGCITLKNLAIGHVGRKKLIKDKNGLEMIVEAMRSFPYRTQIQKYAIGALRNLTAAGDSHSGKEIANENKMHLVKLGTIDLVLKCMYRFLDDVELQLESITLLRNVTSNLECQSEVVEAGTINMVVNVMNRLMYSPQMQEHGLSVLFNLHKNFAYDIVDEGACAVAMEALEKHMDNLKTTEEACAFLWKTAYNAEARRNHIKPNSLLGLGKQALIRHAESHGNLIYYAEGMVKAWKKVRRIDRERNTNEAADKRGQFYDKRRD